MTATTNGSPSLLNDSNFVAQNMIMKFSVSKALKAVLLLGIPDILAKANDNRPLSAAEILEQLPTKSTPGPKSASNLRRLFRPLVRGGFFTEGYNGDKQPVYSLTEVSRWFLRDSEYNLSPVADLVLHPVTVPGWDHLHDLILDETVGSPFEKAEGVPLFEYCRKTNPEFGAVLQAAMTAYAHVYEGLVDNLLECGVLDGVNTIVDVGGGRGGVVADIVARNPHIQGVNFDLPHVIETAPAITGVRHVGGNFFERVPSGDAMFLRFVVHNHGDEDAIKILENCFKALPKNGKVIIGELVLDRNTGPVGEFNEGMDLIMLALVKGGRERTKEEFASLLLAAGFSKSTVIWNHEGGYPFIVGYKEC